MMMASTFPTGRNNSRNIKKGIKEIQLKKEALKTLEAALKKRVNEFRELCLKEGELTGHLPADYPLQPREPIPQVRRRFTRSNGNIPNEFISTSSTMPPPAFVYEETKPFQMSDFYKYSSKFRQRQTQVDQVDGTLVNQQKTTRQLQDDVSRVKNSLKFAACDDQIQQSRKLIEKSGQKLIEATAKAIAGNPSLAERLNNILPNHNHQRQQQSQLQYHHVHNNHHYEQQPNGERY